MSYLVIVESPTKANTIANFLGRDFAVKSSMGHVRDLPKSRLGVDVENGFAPTYITLRGKSKLIKELKEAARKSQRVYLATDPDREGEAIAWHLSEVIDSGIPFHRVTLHEITKEAVNQGFKSSRSIDMSLVLAQQARRILDRLVGYRISPLLWHKIRRGLSAGRVQSVALRMVVEREREITSFTPQEYWTISARLSPLDEESQTNEFIAILLQTSAGEKIELRNEEEALGLKKILEQAQYRVDKAKTRKIKREPPPPFITSTLQQEAWHKLRFSAERTMAIAQQLYEGVSLGKDGTHGLITYMRTDSTRVARSALAQVRDYIQAKYGNEFLPPHARAFNSRVKGAQEAHEAIRPTNMHLQPDTVRSYLSEEQYRLYRLIWERMVASQMANAIFTSTSVDIEAKAELSDTRYLFRATASVNIFPGFLVLYHETRDEEEDAPEMLPSLSSGDKLRLIAVSAAQHFTQPLPRFTEASLIKALEQNGIGRPSTYAPIMATLREREYVTRDQGALKPTELGMVVNDLLVQSFPDVMNLEFTAKMEDELDKIAKGAKDWVSVVKEFYLPLEEDLKHAEDKLPRVKMEYAPTGKACPDCGKPLVIKGGRFGKFLACSGFPECRYTASYAVEIGVKCPECGGDIVAKKSKRKRVFYGCSNYPRCHFATNARPVPYPCPQCGGLLTEYRKKWVKCIKCQYKAKHDNIATGINEDGPGKSV